MGKGSARTAHIETPILPYGFSPFHWRFLGFQPCLQCSTKNTLNFLATKDASTVSVALEGLSRPVMSLVFIMAVYALALPPATACVGRWLSKGRGWGKKPQNIRTPEQLVHPRLLSPAQTQWLSH